jgi:hypothetical protein
MLALKLALVPSLICAITLAGRHWGPAVAGWLSGFPIISAPILFFVAIEQGPAFAVDAAAATLAAVPAALAFLLSYAWVSMRAAWPGSALAGLLAYFAVTALGYVAAPPVYVAAPAVLVAVKVAPQFFPRVPLPAELAPGRNGELLLRMLAGAALVFALTHFAAALGPRLSGLLAMFPVLGVVLAVFSHRHYGHGFTVHLLRGMVLGFYAFVPFCVVLTLALPSVRIGTAFALALACAGIVHGLARRFVRPS